MFVRWKKRMRKDGKNYMLIASLVENKRIDGKPVQKHLLHLGSYSTLQHSSWANYDWKATSFWMRAVEVLNAKGIDLISQEFIYLQLHGRVPLPTPEAIQQYRKNNSYVPDWMNKYEQWYEYNAWRFHVVTTVGKLFHTVVTTWKVFTVVTTFRKYLRKVVTTGRSNPNGR